MRWQQNRGECKIFRHAPAEAAAPSAPEESDRGQRIGFWCPPLGKDRSRPTRPTSWIRADRGDLDRCSGRALSVRLSSICLSAGRTARGAAASGPGAAPAHTDLDRPRAYGRSGRSVAPRASSARLGTRALAHGHSRQGPYNLSAGWAGLRPLRVARDTPSYEHHDARAALPARSRAAPQGCSCAIGRGLATKKPWA